MGLSEDLIAQFVKATKDEDKKLNESTMYATAAPQDGKVYVQFDGSDVLTPAESTVKIEDGDRVVVRIKNHTATVIGNLTNRSASSGDISDIVDEITEVEILIADQIDAVYAKIDKIDAGNITVEELDAIYARIETLEADNIVVGNFAAEIATIKELIAEKADIKFLEANYAKIEDLEATNATINNLEATYAKITDLEAVYAKIETLDADYAKIEDLDVERARIDILEATYLTADSAVIKDLTADIANIDTLIFGSASGNVIQSSFANAVVAQISDAKIKSAMIQSLTASKITAGDINTNAVRVLSEDGKLVIADETIQISDANRVRVQLGKDAAGDYSISIWDAAGKLMFSEGGLTDNAIKDAIIRDDMVSDTANISAGKLNIASLFTEINGSTETIKSSKIYLDDEEQTLDIAFEKMVSDLDSLDGDVTSQGTAISVIQGQIDSKIWMEDISALDISGLEGSITEFTTHYSELKQEINSINATVAAHTTQITNKADSSEVTAVSDKVAELELDLNGFRTEVSETYVEQTEVDGIIARVSDAESQINQNASSIATLVSQTTIIENKFDGYATIEAMESAIEQTAGSITQTVSETYATKEEVEDAQSTADEANEAVGKVNEEVVVAKSSIQQIADAISMLVTDENGSSLMTQTADGGWTFCMGETEKAVNDLSNMLNDLQESTGDTQNTVDALNQAVSDIGSTMEYIRITVFEDEPCIELGESDSDYTLMITNTRILFRAGSSVPTRINTTGIVTKNIEVENDLIHGRWIWSERQNGNYGLRWQEVWVTIVTQPKENVVVTLNDKFTLTVEVTGREPTYQWYYADADSTTWIEETDGIYASLTREALDISMKGRQYYCKITDKYGNSVDSSVATLDIFTPIEI